MLIHLFTLDERKFSSGSSLASLSLVLDTGYTDTNGASGECVCVTEPHKLWNNSGGNHGVEMSSMISALAAVEAFVPWS